MTLLLTAIAVHLMITALLAQKIIREVRSLYQLVASTSLSMSKQVERLDQTEKSR